MPDPPRAAPSHAPKHRLRLLTGIYLAILAAALAILPIWLLRAPEPAPLRPFKQIVPAAPGREQLPPDSRPTTPSTRADQRLPTVRSQPESATTPEIEAPIIDRRWHQRATPGATADPGRLLQAPLIVQVDRRLDRSPEARRRRVQQFGGTRRTEDAVEAGLAWLAAHQDRDGTWDRFEFNRNCPPDDPCPGTAVRRKGYSFRSGLTGLVLLAFLGAGYTDRDGPYTDVVAPAVEALLWSQRSDGGFGDDEMMAGYNNALATFALAEYHALTGEPRVAGALDRAVARLVLSQQELGGWDYLARSDSGRNDTSITAWVIQALHGCAAAGIHVPRGVLVKAALHFDRAAEPDGRVRYSDAGIGFEIDETTLAPLYRHGPAMTAAGLTSEQLLGWRFDSPMVRRQQTLLFEQLPSATLLQGRDPTQLHSYYYWYYGTVAMFQAGAERWERWNARLRDAILPLQDRRKSAAGRKPHAYGSWPPFGPHWGQWGRQGSRVYTTGLCVLTLEIYYRHTPAYLEDHSVLNSDDWRDFLRQASPRDRRRTVQVLRGMRVELAEPVLVDLLHDLDASVARAAAAALTTFDSPLGRPLLEKLPDDVPAWERETLAAALHRAQQIELLPPPAGSVRVYDAQLRLATLEMSRAYVGLVLSVCRDGQAIAQLRVIKRFTASSIVVAELLGEPTGAPPRPGDVVAVR